MNEHRITAPNMMLMLNGAELKDALKDVVKDLWSDVAKSITPQPVVEVKPPEADEGEFISRKRLMERFDLSEATLWRYEQRGILQGYQFGDDDDSRRVFYKLSEVYAALKKKGKHKKAKSEKEEKGGCDL